MAIPPKAKISGLFTLDGKRITFFGENASLLSILAEQDASLKPFIKRGNTSADIPTATLPLFALGAHRNGWILTIE